MFKKYLLSVLVIVIVAFLDYMLGFLEHENVHSFFHSYLMSIWGVTVVGMAEAIFKDKT